MALPRVRCKQRWRDLSELRSRENISRKPKISMYKIVHASQQTQKKKTYKKKQRIENRPTQLKRAAAKLPKSVMQKKIYVRPTARRVQYNKKMKK